MILIKGKSLLTSDRLAWNNTGLYDHHLCSIRAFFRKNCTVHIAGATALVRQEGPGSSDNTSAIENLPEEIIETNVHNGGIQA